ncbi:(2Fe-2S)-binding protein [Ottowia testudinis]|uniref:(2Fe-2S)-binding protein n=1 Tax=Ottowia testudinis TaxID=2816950 RepID=A0A975H3C7_9BURK|nr:(2Fe-2S)-binding protein [Ottowia testudinis]QTD45694.1 (2Fe-2S)-binding protein [Ottowia testudinis]
MVSHLPVHPAHSGLLRRVPGPARAQLRMHIDGVPCWALAGDTLATAVLTQRARLNVNAPGAEPRAGFCLMGACQDCWVWLADGRRVQACMTAAEEGMQVLTAPPPMGGVG